MTAVYEKEHGSCPSPSEGDNDEIATTRDGFELWFDEGTAVIEQMYDHDKEIGLGLP
jgi:hypothetical protein